MKIEDNVLNKMAVLYVIHFGKKDPEVVACKDCLDFKLGLCSGGAGDVGDVFCCMYDKADKCEVFEV